MLLLSNRRHPLAAVRSLAAAGTFIAIGAATTRPLLVVTGAASATLPIDRTAARRRWTSTPRDHK